MQIQKRDKLSRAVDAHTRAWMMVLGSGMQGPEAEAEPRSDLLTVHVG